MKHLLAFVLATAIPLMGASEPGTRKICVYGDGSSAPATCQSHNPGDDDICFCPVGAKEVKAPICKAGERPPPEDRAFREARREALKGSDTLVGADFGGRPMCVDSRDKTTG